VTATRVMFGLAVLLLGGAVVSLLLSLRPAAESPMVVGPLDTDLGTTAPGSRTLMFTITNPADKPRRVIGLAEG
jgi:hypothetical protein